MGPLKPLAEAPRLSRDAPFSEFQKYWSQGIPVVVTGVHTNLQGDWGPQYFIERYGTQRVTLVDCETDNTQQTTVSHFFQNFHCAGDRRQILKLKVTFSVFTALRLTSIIFYRTGPHRLTFGTNFLNFLVLSWVPFHLGTLPVWMAFSTWPPTSRSMELPQIWVSNSPFFYLH
jgi:hypothetical protein